MFALRHTPTWVNHYSQNYVLDSDVVFLSSQDEYRNQPDKPADLPSNYFMPSRADALVRAFRKWFQAAGDPQWLGVAATRSNGESSGWIRVPARSGRDAMLDRYRQHTQICSSCRGAHRKLYVLREVFKYTAFGLLGLSSITRQKAVACLAVLLLLAPRVVLQPLISRLECVPWPRKEWLFSSATQTANVS
jgi:hypothetical protein